MTTFNLVFLSVFGLIGIALLALSAFKRSLDLTMLGSFFFIASVLSLGLLLTQ